MYKRLLFLLTVAVFFVGNAMGQKKNEFEQSQSRIIEPKQDVLIVPLVADIKILDNQQRQDYGPYDFEIASGVESLTFEQLENLKANALYRAAREADADLIVAATFNVYAEKLKGKILYIELSGFPGKYEGFRPATQLKSEELEWMTILYSPHDRNNDYTGKTKALKDK